MAICPNDLITIAATRAEGNGGRCVSCCFDEDGGGRREEFTTEGTEFAECGGKRARRAPGRVPKRDETGIPPTVFQRVRKWRGISGLQIYAFRECANI